MDLAVIAAPVSSLSWKARARFPRLSCPPISTGTSHGFGTDRNVIAIRRRAIGIVRARCKIGMTNLVYNMRRFVCLERMTAAAG